MDPPVSEPEGKSVIDLTQESVHTTDNKDIGYIEAMNKDSIVVKRRFRDIHYYYIPISKVEGWDGHVVWLNISETEVINNYKPVEQPDPLRYHTKERGYSDTDIINTRDELPSVTVISYKGKWHSSMHLQNSYQFSVSFHENGMVIIIQSKPKFELIVRVNWKHN